MRPKRLLIVEGNWNEGESLKKEWEAKKYVVKVVQTIWEALEVLESNRDFDFILANLNQNSSLVRQLTGAKQS